MSPSTFPQSPSRSARLQAAHRAVGVMQGLLGLSLLQSPVAASPGQSPLPSGGSVTEACAHTPSEDPGESLQRCQAALRTLRSEEPDPQALFQGLLSQAQLAYELGELELLRGLLPELRSAEERLPSLSPVQAWTRAVLGAGLLRADHAWQEAYELLAPFQESSALSGSARLSLHHELAFLASSLGLWREEEEHSRRTLSELPEELKGSAMHADLLTNRGAKLLEDGRSWEALVLLEESEQLRRGLYEAPHPLLAQSLANRAMAMRSLGDSKRAVELLQESLEMYRALETEAPHPRTAVTLNNLAMMMHALGEPERALRYQQESVERQRTTPSRPLYFLRCALTLSHYLRLAGRVEEAERQLEEARSFQAAVWSPQHSSYLSLLNTEVSARLHEGDKQAAARLLEELLPLQEQILGPRHRDTLKARSNLYTLQMNIGQVELAEQGLQQLMEEHEEALGSEHSALRAARRVMAELMVREERYEEALPLFEQNLEQEVQQLLQKMSISGPPGRAKLEAELLRSRSQLLQISMESLPQDRSYAELALRLLLLTKSSQLHIQGLTLETFRESLSQETQGLMVELESLTQQLNTLQRGGMEELRGGAEPLEALRERQAALLELLRNSQGLRLPELGWELEALWEQIPPDTLLLEWAQWPSLEPDGGEQLGFFLLSREGLVGWQKVGSLETVQTLCQQLRRDLQREFELGFPQQGPRSRERARELGALILGSLEPQLEGASRLLIAPVGVLSELPWELLPQLSEGEGEELSPILLHSGRDLMWLDRHPPGDRGPLILADIDYGTEEHRTLGGRGDAADLQESLRQLRRPAEGRDGPRWEPLPGSRREGERIRGMLAEASLLTGEDASESALRYSKGHSVLHIATHGYHADSSEGSGRRSGIVLAGANSQGLGLDNGYLSAEEIMYLDLRGTELVVLSACVTGRSQSRGEGDIQGLRQALHLAGTESQVLSLWEVSDEATQVLMEALYDRLLDGASRSEALRGAKAELRQDPRFQHPSYWAAFVLSGDWRPLDAQLTAPSLWQRWRERRSQD